MKLSFEIPGQPVAKARPRLGRRGVYTEPKTAAYERTVALLARAAADRHGWITPARGRPLDLLVVAVFTRPQRLRRRSDPSGLLPKATRPDLDNLIKSVMDGLQIAGVMVDDGQVATLAASKWWAELNGDPRVVVNLSQRGGP